MSTLEALIQAGQALPSTERQKLIEALRLDSDPDPLAARLRNRHDHGWTHSHSSRHRDYRGAGANHFGTKAIVTGPSEPLTESSP